ncbi:uncharacterized protein LOC131436825 [Malaya genurostris]|uniref:uncharacterized protein LOC131436825 n=1 Tax=Malaya genurostris TaxID=325434 RepID=UPI0026F3BBE3|nr:uncharacterized protein LOC131436825 [Malaya genurostris]
MIFFARLFQRPGCSKRIEPEADHRMNRTLKPKPKTTFRNVSPIAETTKSTDSSLRQQSSVVSDPDVHCGKNFRSGLMIFVFSTHLLISATIFAVGLTLTLLPPSTDHACHVYFAVIYLRIAFWIGTYIQHDLIKPACHMLVNLNYSLYRDMTCYRKAPLRIVSFWNMILLAIQSYIRSLFRIGEQEANICGGQSGHEFDDVLNITPQLFISIFSGLETLALACFYVPAIKRLTKSMQQQEEDSPDRTLSNQDDITIHQRLKRQAEQVKILRAANVTLRKEAAELGVLIEDN